MNKVIRFIVLILIISNPLLGQKKYVDEIIAKIDNYIVLQSDLDTELLRYAAAGKTPDEDMKCKILENIIIGKLLVAKAEIDSIMVDDKMLEAELDERFRVMLAGEDPKVLQERYGKSIEVLKSEYRSLLREQKLAQKMQYAILEDIKVTPQEVRAFFNTIPKDSLPIFPTEIEVAQIVKIPKVQEEEINKVKDKLILIKRRVEQGEKFADLAETYSVDYGSAKNGGSLGWQKRGQLVPQFEAVAFRLKPGEVSDIVETEYGYHLIQLQDRRGEEHLSSHILLQPDYSLVDSYASKIYLDSLKLLIRSDSITFEKAAIEHSDDASTAMNGGYLQNPQDGSHKISVDVLGNMDSYAYFTTDTMQVGTVSDPIPYRTNEGKTALRLLYYKARHPAHQASMEKDYQKLQNAALSNKKNEVLQKWLKEAVKDVYIEVIDRYKECNILNLNH